MSVPDYEAGYQASRALIDSWGARAQEQVARADALQREMEQLSITRWSPGREVGVTIDSAGLLRDVEFTEASRTRSAAALSRLLLTALRSAMGELRTRAEEIAAEHVGPDSLASTLAAQYESALSGPLASLRANGAAETSDRGPDAPPGTDPGAPRAR